MQVDDPRGDDTFDRELRQALAGRGEATPGAHLDAELAAAWMDQRLDAATAQSIDAHLAACADCQTLIATLARLMPDAPATAGAGWWRRLRAGWLIPATVAAAAGLVIWVALPQPRVPASPPAESLQASANRAPAANQPDVPPGGSATGAAPQTATRPVARSEADFDRLPKGKDTAPASAAAPMLAPVVPVPAPPASSPAAPPAERRDQIADAPADARPNVEAKSEAPEKAAVAADASTARQNISPEQSRSFNESTAAARRGALAAVRQNDPVVWVASDGAARWRPAGAQIEFAPRADAGFIPASLPVAAETLANASAPGGTVCWIVGRGGIVVVTADGVRFTRTAAPTPANLVSVAATDARTAIVTAEDGRRFRTADQGATWTAVP